MVDNAIKYAPAGSRVRIRSHEEFEFYVCIQVEDQGPGIPEEERATDLWQVLPGRAGAAGGGRGHRPLPGKTDPGAAGRLYQGQLPGRAREALLDFIFPGKIKSVNCVRFGKECGKIDVI